MSRRSEPRILTVRPEPDAYAWTFGGVPPVARIAPGTVLDLWTEDCFAGRVRSEKDLVSEVCEFPYVNPQTGPFYVEGAEPGDTVAVHFVSVEPARDWAASTTIPLFGALTSTHSTASLQQPLPERVWIWELDRVRRTARFTAHENALSLDLPLDPMHGTVGVAPANLEVRSSWCRTRTAATWTRPRCARASPAISGSMSRARCSASATGTRGRVRARPAGWPWSAP